MSNRSGWAYGERIPATSPYLTIMGSYYTQPDLYATRLEAQAALDASPQRDNPYLSTEVAHVTETGRTTFRITLCEAGCNRPAAPGRAGRCDQPATCQAIRNAA